jgi:Ca-activated chloride channel homolog
MTRSITVLFMLFSILTGFGQEWKDTLKQARAYYKESRYLESLEYYRSAQKLAPENVDLSEEEGLAAFRAGKFKDAEKIFGHAAAQQKDPKRKSSAYNNVGYSRMEQQNYAGAEESFKEALRQNPQNEKARQNLAEARRIRKQKEQQQQQQQQNQDQNNSGNNNQQQNGDQQGKPGQQGQGQQQSNPQSGGSQDKQQAGSGSKPKLNDKQTDRKLDELMRKEGGVKKRMDGSKGTGNAGGTGKDW